jgi:DNA-binding LacI/PurR family transcriptional regulator
MRIEDIARQANVSKSAVSIVLNDKPGVSPETRQRILELVRQSGYIPRSMIKSERMYRSPKLIRFLACVSSAVVSPQYSSSTFFSSLIHGLEKKCRQFGYGLMFASMEGTDIASELRSMESEHPVKGVVLLGTNLSKPDIEAIARHTPNIVVIDNCYDSTDLDFVVMNNTAGAYAAVRYLVGLGHERIGYVGSCTRVHNFDLRREGFERAIADSALSTDPNMMFSVRPSIDGAFTDFSDILKTEAPLPDAMFCESDYMAIGVMKALTAQGIRVPEDISISGFDDVPEASIVSPGLTTVHVEKERIGEIAIQRLHDRIEKKADYTMKILIDTRIVKRSSCQERERTITNPEAASESTDAKSTPNGI